MLTDLQDELALLAEADPEQIDTTLLILPDAFDDFLDFNDFEEISNRLLKRMDLVGELRSRPSIRSSSSPTPSRTISRTAPTVRRIRSCTCCAKSIDRAVDAFPDAAEIYEKNIETMKRLGVEGWKRLMRAP